ncbi:TlpA family protein disulfide reductase [Sulfurimonas autotrophica]|uniref:Redoxin domain protein n=1 Tax=Sulfurimonas autotrophica (strain ATCC BAA-671 / DSM 16294 / JCM 11897 / OK10) TaxID=563040 RepID=E0UUB0_SULAO|nr:TlpA disulfide reductase family protein [Sulfurimonas autotrophica]ADN09485.1 Redoxin domain protein [Sulfurimonas autotrophica DSM 16294]
MRKIPLLTTLLTIGLLFGACSKEKESTTQEANSLLATNKIVLTSLNNKQFVVEKTDTGLKLKDAKDKVVIYDIFATWCPPCQAEASHLASLQKKYKDKLIVLGVTVENNIPNEKLEEFAKQHHADYTLVNSSANMRLIDKIAKQLHLGKDFGIPLMVLYKDGKIINYYQGATEEEFIESDIKKALDL